ncbi:uncharacterized protein SETTUDRAFT_157515 [Exserohilum turcica Et28A]|uniref:Uncharacterized protein n=1 Tax=Exserohilum turcicum (strain 28A) TaxID=671987 RepID=R0JVV6_EXST2|nr:uncharacterized protein SETTUDRAFT_157515 [Exserohilum turcica Et28A]EOA81614.1 hypothetical protein SETTUDRAFT_157515 [Exserohilum turcica Et28A]
MPHGQPPTTSDVGCRARATSVFDIFAARPACEKKPYLEPDDLFVSSLVALAQALLTGYET